MPSTYEPSGEVEPSFFAYAAAGLAVSVGLGWLYQLLLAWIPLIYLSFLITLAFGFGL